MDVNENDPLSKGEVNMKKVKKAFMSMFLGAVLWIPIFYKIFVG